MTVKILDLFAGAGGLSLGFELVRDSNNKKIFELYRAAEVDKYACATLRSRYGNERIIEGDLTSKKIHERIINECNGKVSIVVGGIPCQSFSLIGPRSGFGKKMAKFKDDKRDHLYKEFKTIVKKLRPNIVLIENVRGILSKRDSKGKLIIDRIVSDFERIGYHFRNDRDGSKFMILNAADYGVPQKRARVILIGILKEWKKFDVPFIDATHRDPHSGNKSDNMLPYVTTYEAIGDLPEVHAPKTSFVDKQLTNGIETKFKGADKMPVNQKNIQEHINTISASGKQFFRFVRPNGYAYIDHHIARSHQISDIRLFKEMKEGETANDFLARKPQMARKLIKYDMTTFKDKYRKQRWDAPSTTVFAHLEKDGNRFIHPRQARTLTPREAARIQSFPDDFIFEGPISKKFKQIGNAVPPLLANRIAQKLFECFGNDW